MKTFISILAIALTVVAGIVAVTHITAYSACVAAEPSGN
jgi:hypothetical protein